MKFPQFAHYFIVLVSGTVARYSFPLFAPLFFIDPVAILFSPPVAASVARASYSLVLSILL
jgi:hypothetical protein